MKILHITATHLNPNGGVPIVLERLVTHQNQNKNVKANVISLKATVNNINSPYFDAVEIKKCKNYISDFMPDCIIFHSFFYIEYVAVMGIINRLNIPYYIEPHGSFGRAAMKKSAFKKKIANETIFKGLINNAKGYIFLNEAEYEDSVYHKEYDCIIPNGVDGICDKSEEEKKNKFFYFIGRYDINHKGLDYLFDALDILDKKMADIQFKFFGTGNKTEIEFVNDRISKLKYVHASNEGAISREQQATILNEAGIMVLTSRYEGLPMTILEALTYGNPCIVTPGTNFQKEIVKNNVGLGCLLNAVDIADAILEMNNLYEQDKAGYRTRCKEFVNRDYNWAKIAKQSIKELSK